MSETKKAKLEKLGYAVGDYGDFLGLTAAERQLVELRVKVAYLIRTKRERAKLSQKEFAARLKTTQPRVAKMEAAAPDVSMDKLLGGYFDLGGTLKELHADAAFC